MISQISIGKQDFKVDLNQGIDISIPLRSGPDQLKCFYAPDFNISPVRTSEFIGSIKEGGQINFQNIFLNPHGNGTHTECLSHIWPSDLTINQCLLQFFHYTQLITVKPRQGDNGDQIIKRKDIEPNLKGGGKIKSLIVRTLPNDPRKLKKNYSGSNPPYFCPKAIEFMVAEGINHLLTDLPSVDKEMDGGALAAHKAFWGLPHKPRPNATITELVYVENTVKDGLYLLNLQIVSLEMDASPSKPVLYELSL
jgi:kynurenine formamidase